MLSYLHPFVFTFMSRRLSYCFTVTALKLSVAIKIKTAQYYTTWFFRKKTYPAGNLLKFKARLCVRGFGQVEGVDYNKTFVSTGRPGSLSLLLALCAHNGWDIHQMDVKTAFLHGVVDEDVYLKIPEGYDNEVPPNSCLKLRKSL